MDLHLQGTIYDGSGPLISDLLPTSPPPLPSQPSPGGSLHMSLVLFRVSVSINHQRQQKEQESNRVTGDAMAIWIILADCKAD